MLKFDKNHLIIIKSFMKQTTDWQSFANLDIRVGTITDAEPFTKARKPAYILHIDFGEKIGYKKTSAQITKLYTPKDLIGKQIVAIVNFPDKQIANIQSECLVLGAVDGDTVTLLQLERKTENGLPIG